MFRGLLSQKPVTKLALTPPDPQPGRAGIALALIVRNEARHIGEWAAFHLTAGVAHVPRPALPDSCYAPPFRPALPWRAPLDRVTTAMCRRSALHLPLRNLILGGRVEA